MHFSTQNKSCYYWLFRISFVTTSQPWYLENLKSIWNILKRSLQSFRCNEIFEFMTAKEKKIRGWIARLRQRVSVNYATLFFFSCFCHCSWKYNSMTFRRQKIVYETFPETSFFASVLRNGGISGLRFYVALGCCFHWVLQCDSFDE